jgi:hypothetical protein
MAASSRFRWAPVVLLLLTTGCYLSRQGPALEDLAPAWGPRGMTITLDTRWGDLPVELLEVADEGVLVLHREAILELPWLELRAATLPGWGRLELDRRPPTSRTRERLRAGSRHGAGLSPAQRTELLRAHGQDGPRQVPLPRSLRLPDIHHGHDTRAPETVGSQAQAPEAEAFLQEVQASLGRFEDPGEAILSGYRPLGPDFPGMGEHWVNGPRALAGPLDPSRPAVLTYLESAGDRILTGAAFVTVLAPEDPPLAFPFPGAWHDHSGSVDEETLALSPASALHPRPNEPRIAMLHVWTHLANPHGPFAQDNWAVPFVRLGLPVPDAPSAEAGKALFLASDGDLYYHRLVATLATLTPEEDRAVAAVMARGRRRVEGLLNVNTSRLAPVEDDELLDRLEGIWHTLWLELSAQIGPEAWEAVQLLGR